jgi:putative restriction endonuclease
VRVGQTAFKALVQEACGRRVSPRLREEYGNGEEFYVRARAREAVASPARRADQPNAEFLQWHADAVFLAS